MLPDFQPLIQRSSLASSDQDQWIKIFSLLSPQAKVWLENFVADQEENLLILNDYLKQQKEKWSKIISAGNGLF